MKGFSGPFGERIADFLDYRTARGFKRETYIRHFIMFDRWCLENHPGQDHLSRELVHSWIGGDTVSIHDTARKGTQNPGCPVDGKDHAAFTEISV